MKKLVGLLMVLMFLGSLGAVPAFQGRYVKAGSLSNARVIVEVKSPDGKPVLEVGKENTILVKVLDQYGNPITGLNVELGFSFTYKGELRSNYQAKWNDEGYYVVHLSPKIIGKFYVHVFVNNNEKLIASTIAWKSGFPMPPEGWAILLESPLPYVIVNKEKYHVYLMGNPDTQQLSWLVLSEDGSIPNLDTYKKAAETATIALFFDEDVMNDFLTAGAHSELIKWYFEEIENVKMLKNILLLALTMGLSATTKASEAFMNTYTKELGSYHGIHVAGGHIIKSSLARHLSKKVAADAARQVYYSTLWEELVNEYGKEYAKEYLAELVKNMDPRIFSQLDSPTISPEEYTSILLYPSMVYTIEQLAKRDQNVVTFLISPNEPVEHYIAEASAGLASEHLMRAYVVWAIKNGLSLEDIKTNAYDAIYNAWSQQSLIAKVVSPGILVSAEQSFTQLGNNWYLKYVSTSQHSDMDFETLPIGITQGAWNYHEANEFFNELWLGIQYGIIGAYMAQISADVDLRLTLYEALNDILGAFGIAKGVSLLEALSLGFSAGLQAATSQEVQEVLSRYPNMFKELERINSNMEFFVRMWEDNVDQVYPYLTSKNRLTISQAYLDKSSYEPGETATLTVKVVDSNGNPVDAKVTFYVYTGPGSRTPVEMEKVGEGTYQKTFQVPDKPMMYNVYITAENPVYGNSYSTVGFTVTKVTLIEPTSKNPAYVGSPANPKPFYIKLSTGVPYLDTGKLLKRVWIDHRINPIFKYIGTDSNGYAVYRVYTPPMSKEGKYDLTIELYNGLEITEKDAVVYSSSNNVDIVLVIDSSGSMHSYCGLFSCWKGSDDKDLRLKAAKMLVDTLDYGDGVAVVDFDWYIRAYPPDKKLLYISTPEDREKLKSFIDTIDANGGTYIGKGLKAAYDILNNSQDTHPKYVMLLTDGDDNSGDPYNPLKVAEDFKDRGWKVYTIGLTSGWYTSENRPFLNSDLLMKIADITGGRYYEADKADVLLQIYNSIKGIAKNKNTISSKSTKLKRRESTTQSVFIDPTVKEGEFSIAWSGSEFNLTLISPDGNVMTPEVAQEDPNITYIKGDTYVIYEVKNPVPGEWKMNITAVNVPEEGEEVTSMVLADTNLTIDLFTEKSIYKLNEPIRLVGLLTLNGEPVDGIVNATIIKPDGSVDYLALEDKSNGIYETYYIPKESGSYTITLQAMGEINGVPFTRQTTFSVYVSREKIPEEFRASIDKIEFTTVSGRTLSFDFTLNSTVQDIVRVGITSLSNGTNTIAVNYTETSGIFSIVPDENVPLHVEFTIPFDAKPGKYTGEVVVQGRDSVLTIPIEVEVEPRLQYAPEDVSLYSADIDVNNVEVYEISNETLRQITGEIPEIKNLRAFVVFSSGFGNFKLRITSIKDTADIKVLKYDWNSKEWKEMPFEKGSIILPLSVDGFSTDIILLGEAIPSKTSAKESYANIITLSRVWTQWFFKYYDEFNKLYVNVTGLGIDNETLQKALELHNNATELIKDAWRADDLESIRNNLWRGSIILPVPKFWEIRKAYLLEKQAIDILRNAIKNRG